jgi:hypothetical protein
VTGEPTLVRHLPELSRGTDHRGGEGLEASDADTNHAASEEPYPRVDDCVGHARGHLAEGDTRLLRIGLAEEPQGHVPLLTSRIPDTDSLWTGPRFEDVEHVVGRPDRDEEALAQPTSTRSSRRNRNRLSAEIVANCRI